MISQMSERAAAHESQHLSGDQKAQLRITIEDVRHWAEVGEQCKRL